MRDIIETVAESIEAEAFAQSWTIRKHDPVWRAPEGQTVYVYGTRRFPYPGFQMSYEGGGRLDVYEVIIEFVEKSSQKQQQTLKRDETLELSAYEEADRFTSWADAHTEFPPLIEAFDWQETSYAPQVAQEFLVRYCRLTFHARKFASYG